VLRGSSIPPWYSKSECCSTGSFHRWTCSHHWIPSSGLLQIWL